VARGLELALMGVDGTGKTSVASALMQLRIPVRVIYMGGYKQFRSWPMRLAERGLLPWPLSRIATHYELLTKRATGWWAARGGYLVVYDRHPVELYKPNPRFMKTRVHNILNSLYRFPTDLTFWFTGDYQLIYSRKREQSAAHLKQMDEELGELLRIHGIEYCKVDVTRNDLTSVVETITGQICEKCPEFARSLHRSAA
jgi:hypothetical protein